jgi:hypothetical protein
MPVKSHPRVIADEPGGVNEGVVHCIIVKIEGGAINSHAKARSREEMGTMVGAGDGQ